ncbi:hypothetical protein ABIC51_002223 [Burkholderia sp. 572]
MRACRHRPTPNRMKIPPESKSPAKRQHFAGLGQNRNPTGLRQSPVNRPGQYVDATPVKRTGAA